MPSELLASGVQCACVNSSVPVIAVKTSKATHVNSTKKKGNAWLCAVLFCLCILAPRPPGLAQVVARPFSQRPPSTGGLHINARLHSAGTDSHAITNRCSFSDGVMRQAENAQVRVGKRSRKEHVHQGVREAASECWVLQHAVQLDAARLRVY
jgi:hypothetical protein